MSDIEFVDVNGRVGLKPKNEEPILLNHHEVISILNDQYGELEQTIKDLVDHSALILMLEDYQALGIDEILWNLTYVETEEEFNELYKSYLEKAKEKWGIDCL